MEMKQIVGFILFLTVTVSFAGGEPPASIYRASFPAKITVLQNGVVDQQSSGAGQENCRSFNLNAAIVKAYFQKAHAIESTHDYQWSAVASLKVRLHSLTVTREAGKSTQADWVSLP